VRNGDLFWAAVGLQPKNSLAVLGETAWREIGDAVNAARDSFNPAALYEAG
jgi:hypothetical protein